MNRNRDDDDLARRFEQLRAEDLRELPAFRRLLRSRAAPAAGGRRRVVRAGFALAGAVALALGAVWLSSGWPAAPAPDPDPSALLAWRSPTETLLRTPGIELVRGLPSVGELGFHALGPREPRTKEGGPGSLRP